MRATKLMTAFTLGVASLIVAATAPAQATRAQGHGRSKRGARCRGRHDERRTPNVNAVMSFVARIDVSSLFGHSGHRRCPPPRAPLPTLLHGSSHSPGRTAIGPLVLERLDRTPHGPERPGDFPEPAWRLRVPNLFPLRRRASTSLALSSESLSGAACGIPNRRSRLLLDIHRNRYHLVTLLACSAVFFMTSLSSLPCAHEVAAGHEIGAPEFLSPRQTPSRKVNDVSESKRRHDVRRRRSAAAPDESACRLTCAPASSSRRSSSR